MSAYPDGKFIQTFALRTLQNLRDIANDRALSYDDTAMISMMLAVFVFPNERIADKSFMGQLLTTYDRVELSKIVAIIRPNLEGGEPIPKGLPQSLDEVPKFIRHSIAHFNIRPVSGDANRNTLTHLLVWNRNPDNKKITFVAQIHLKKFRKFAAFVLGELAKKGNADKVDGFDPVAQFDKDHGVKQTMCREKTDLPT